jgi:ferredoxin
MIKNTIPTLYEVKDDCTGCTACYSVCPHKAILMIEDEEGFLYPIINEELCKRCQLCIKVCIIKEEKK